MGAEVWRVRWLLIVMAAVPVALVAVSTIKGPGISEDSVTYVYAARSFAATGHFDLYSGGPLTVFPPGFPLLLGLATKIGIHVQTAAIALDVVCVGLLVVFTYLLAREIDLSEAGSLIAAAVVALSTATLAVFSMLWTEPPFVVLVLVVLFVLARAVRAGRMNLGSAAMIAVFASLAQATRYIGISLIPAIVLGTFYAERQGSRRDAVVRALALGLASSLGTIIVVGRNLLHGVGVFGPRSGHGSAISSVLKTSLSTMSSYVLAGRLNREAISIGAVIVLLLILGALHAVQRRNFAGIVLTTFIATYWLFLWYGEVTNPLNFVDFRLTAPVMPAVMVLATYATLNVLTEFGSRFASAGHWAKLLPVACLVVMFLLLTGSFVNDVRTANAASNGGVGGIGNTYNSPSSLDSPLTRAVQRLPGSPGVASNDPQYLYWTTGRKQIAQIPTTDYFTTADETGVELRTLKAAVSSGAVRYLAYINGSRPALQPSELAKSGIHCTLNRSTPQGNLYYCT